jgi:hypothetical protein
MLAVEMTEPLQQPGIALIRIEVRIASGRPSPMMPFIVASPSGSRSQAAAATRMDSTMRPMESTSVPSQSKINSR